MSLITLLVVLLVVGLLLYLVHTLLPLPQPIRIAIDVVVVLILCAWLLHAVGLAPRLRVA